MKGRPAWVALFRSMAALSPKYLMPQCKRMTAFSVFDPRPVGPLLSFRVLSPKFLSLT
ncbi:MAG: hypothetical protein ACI9TZ_003050, partial [Yoonia sp.]